METIEMDLMQAQIGSLTTEVSRLEAKVAKGGGESNIEIVNVNDITFSDFFTTGRGTASKSSAEITDLISAGKVVFLKAEIPNTGTYISCPIEATSQEEAVATLISTITTSGDDLTEMRVMRIIVSPTNLTTITNYTGTF